MAEAKISFQAFSVIAKLPVAGLGDEAGFQKLKDGGTLSIRKGRTVITILLHSKKQKNGLGALKALGRAVVGKL